MDKKQPTKTREELAAEIVELIGDRANSRGDLADILDLVQREIWRREDAKAAARREARIEAAKIESNLLPWPEYAEKYGLHESERRAAGIYLPKKNIEQGITYFHDTAPTDEQRQKLADETTMSKRQAADYLGITPGQFDKLKKAHGLERVSSIRTGKISGGFPVAAHLYRKSDIDRLKPDASGDHN